MTTEEKEIVRFLQEEITLTFRPYLELAQKLGMTEQEILKKIEEMMRNGQLKRISVVLYHSKVGYTVNSMVVWDIEEHRLDQVSKRILDLPYVTHCYSRNRVPEFDFNFYTMIHARSEEEYQEILDEMRNVIRPLKFSSLKTVQELKKKKKGMKYFSEEL